MVYQGSAAKFAILYSFFSHFLVCKISIFIFCFHFSFYSSCNHTLECFNFDGLLCAIMAALNGKRHFFLWQLPRGYTVTNHHFKSTNFNFSKPSFFLQTKTIAAQTSLQSQQKHTQTSTQLEYRTTFTQQSSKSIVLNTLQRVSRV